MVLIMRKSFTLAVVVLVFVTATAYVVDASTEAITKEPTAEASEGATNRLIEKTRDESVKADKEELNMVLVEESTERSVSETDGKPTKNVAEGLTKGAGEKLTNESIEEPTELTTEKPKQKYKIDQAIVDNELAGLKLAAEIDGILSNASLPVREKQLLIEELDAEAQLQNRSNSVKEIVSVTPLHAKQNPQIVRRVPSSTSYRVKRYSNGGCTKDCCSRTMYPEVHSYTSSYAAVCYSDVYYYVRVRCGWWGWGRCTRLRSYTSGYTCYSRRNVYYHVYKPCPYRYKSCCNGLFWYNNCCMSMDAVTALIKKTVKCTTPAPQPAPPGNGDPVYNK